MLLTVFSRLNRENYSNPRYCSKSFFFFDVTNESIRNRPRNYFFNNIKNISPEQTKRKCHFRLTGFSATGNPWVFYIFDEVTFSERRNYEQALHHRYRTTCFSFFFFYFYRRFMQMPAFSRLVLTPFHLKYFHTLFLLLCVNLFIVKIFWWFPDYWFCNEVSYVSLRKRLFFTSYDNDLKW